MSLRVAFPKTQFLIGYRNQVSLSKSNRRSWTVRKHGANLEKSRTNVSQSMLHTLCPGLPPFRPNFQTHAFSDKGPGNGAAWGTVQALACKRVSQ